MSKAQCVLLHSLLGEVQQALRYSFGCSLVAGVALLGMGIIVAGWKNS